MLQFQTFSVIAGTEACNARCDFCISQMTPQQGVTTKYSGINFDNLRDACRLAVMAGVTTALITGKGEPTLFPEDITRYLEVLHEFFPIIELQTNAINFTQHAPRPMHYGGDNRSILERGGAIAGKNIGQVNKQWLEFDSDYLPHWKQLGLKTIIISVVHYNDLENQKIYCDQDGKYRFNYPPLEDTVRYLRSYGYNIRLSIVGCRGFIDSPEELSNFIDFAKENKIDQLTWRPVTKPNTSRRDDIYDATVRLSVDQDRIAAIQSFARLNGTRILKLVHNAEVFDIRGQNLCLSNCLTHSEKGEEQRQLIYFPNGKLRYSWEYTGAVIF